ncbi:hypothetical protein LAZ67_X002202 [Cordylochernes scorpioides]|uniref:Uncharacterized protein n=1 Tax=Cordylochernes scorpioides TaxID=51811 RepID=A0ABY6LXB3_9ARAC|nr:hypothetical protein LAZ67_X002202 [Cordylochernes scorpioides]
MSASRPQKQAMKKKVLCDFCKKDGHYAIMCKGEDHAEGSKVVLTVIDSGSSQSYILEHLVKDLGVPIMGEEELDHEIFDGIGYTDRHRI